MANAKTSSQPIRKLSKSGRGSYYVTLPLKLIQKKGWQKGQKLVVKEQGAAFIIEDWDI